MPFDINTASSLSAVLFTSWALFTFTMPSPVNAEGVKIIMVKKAKIKDRIEKFLNNG
jgi:hypothetical protein